MITKADFFGRSEQRTLSSDVTINFRYAAIWDFTCPTPGHTATLPRAASMLRGGTWAIINRGVEDLDVADNAGEVLVTLSADQGVLVGLLDNSSDKGEWVLASRAIGMVDNPPVPVLGYTFGGDDTGPGDQTVTILEWDPQLQTWTAKADMAIGRQNCAAFTAGGAGYITGKRDTGFHLDNDRLDEYDPDVWAARLDMPQERYRHQAAQGSDGSEPIGVLLGGIANPGAPGVFADTPEHYSKASNTWTSGTDQPDGRIQAGAWQMGSTLIHVAGGRFSDGPNSFQEEHESYTLDTEVWAAMRDLAYPFRGDYTALATSTKAYVTCGTNNTSANNSTTFADHHEYDPVGDTFTTRIPYPEGRVSTQGGCVIEDKLYVWGGENHEEPPATASAKTDATHKYDPLTETWSAQQAMPLARNDIARTNAAIQR